MIKRILIGFAIFIVVAAGLLAAYFYFYPNKAQNLLIPKIEHLQTAEISLSNDTAFADLLIRMENRGLFKISIDSIVYKINFDTLRIMSGSQFLGIRLNTKDADTIKLPVAIPYKRIGQRIKDLQSRDTVDIKTDIRLVYSTIFGKTSVPHEKTHRIGTPRPPKFEVEKIEFIGRQDKKIKLEVTVKMHNSGKLELSLDSLQYRITVADLLTASGTRLGAINVKPRSTITKKFPIEVDLKKPWKVFTKVITNKDMVPYQLDVKGSVQTAGSKNKPTMLEVTKAGEFELKK